MTGNKMFDLTGHVAFVTGAAKGLGLAMAEVVAAHGARVVMTDINSESLDASVSRLKNGGFDVTGEQLDVASLSKITSSIDSVALREGRLDIVFANAGMSGGPGPLTDTGALAQLDIERWNTLLHTNLTSVLVTIKAASTHMMRRRYGRIIVTGSIAGLRGERMCSYSYAATKAAISNLVRQSAVELSQHGIAINAIAPDAFLTDIGDGRLHDPQVAAAFASNVPIGRIGLPEEIKGLALLLASPASSYLTGTVIPIDGGTTAC